MPTTEDVHDNGGFDGTAIAVTGMACRFPGADSIDAYWDLLCSGGEPLERVPDEELRAAGLLENARTDPSYVALRKPFADPSLFDAGFFGMTPAEAAATDPQQRMLLETAVQALEDAGVDPARFPGGIGVYLGMNHSDYLLRNVLGHRDVIDRLGWHRVLMGNDRGFTATSLSYRLGLTGPSIAVDCACSSSLAAVHQACRALMDFEADAALVGGAGVKPRDLGYRYSEGGIGSPDGRCRPFSADARGTVFASGVGLVVLRRLEDALADGDRVLAVVRASDMNNDGARKSSYTAPSHEGQAELIAGVHELAGVTADRITYVEAHGTGTALGDPIEVGALADAFRATSDMRGFCALGSAKANIGHLDSASGIAGFIKVVLALRHRVLPPTPGCERLNPHIDFQNSPFRVVRELEPWDAPGPLMAGVSSFGVGGTNVHVLLEEHVERAEAEPGHPGTSVLLPFSAKSEGSLRAMESELRDWASTTPTAAVADGAHELVTRRTVHPMRGALLWRRSEDVVVLDPGRGDAELTGRKPAFSLNTPELDQAAVSSLLERHPPFSRTAERLVGPLAAERGVTPRQVLEELADEAPPVTSTVVALGCAAVWAELGIEPGAVLADQDSRLAAAVLSGALERDALCDVLARIAAGGDAVSALGAVTLRAPVIPWYDADGSELCSPGQSPSPACAPGGRPAPPGWRTLPPRVPAVIELCPAPGPRGDVKVFSGAPRLGAPRGVAAGHDSVLATAGQAWALGLPMDIAGLVESRPRRAEALPGYRFERRRHWLDPEPAGAAPKGHVTAAPDADAGAADFHGGACELFAQALGLDEVESHDDLFSLGGDSLLATRIVALAQARWGHRVPFGTFLRTPTPAGLAAVLEESAAASTPRAVGGVPTERAEGRPSTVLPVTPLQERFLHLSELDGAAESYNVPVLADLRGPLDPAALQAAFADVVDRHESLRVAFRHGQDGFVQVVAERTTADLPLVEVAEEDLSGAVAELLDSTIALEKAPLFRGRIFRLGPERHVFALVLHHIIADARSTGVLLTDLYACYEEHTSGRPAALAPVAGRLAAYSRAQADWRESEAARRQLQYWLRELADLPEPIELPGDRPRGTQRSYRGAKLEFTMPAEVSARVRRLAAQQGTTPFAVVLAAFGCWLSRIANRESLIIGAPVSGRHRADNQNLIGNFVNTLPLRARIDERRSFADLLRGTVTRLTDALDNQDLPFEAVARELGRDPRDAEPVFQVLFNMLSASASIPPAPSGLTVEPLPFDRATSPYELSLDWWFSSDGAIAGRFLYDTDRFDRDTVAAWQESFAFLLDAVSRAPLAPLSTVRSAPPAARARCSAALTGAVVEVPQRPVHAVFAEQAERNPDRLAVTDGRTSVSYGRLARISAGLADQVTGSGVGPGEPVGIAMRRGTALVAALLGVLRAGATPVPLDPTLPARRLALMAEDAGVKLILARSARDASFAPEVRVLRVPPLAEIAGREGGTAGDGCPGDTGAYVTYTSGTTGRPKGIHFPHRALANLVHWETEGHRVARRWLQFASFGFDAAFHETFSALCGGGSLHILDDDSKHDHDALASFVEAHRVEKAIVPVSLLHALAARFADDPAPFATVREIASTGEQLRISRPLVAFFERMPHCRLVNNYGPAETHVVTSYRFPERPREWPWHAPIGSPIQNVRLAITGVGGQDAPPGSVGELFISGRCVATGYLNQPELTEEKFRAVPEGGRAYRSGDLVRLLRSGLIEFTGRRDQQVKIRGHRVELGEIEVCIRREAGVDDVALAVRGPDGDRRIDAYLVVGDRDPEVVTRVRKRIRAELPVAMMPATFTVLDRLPVNANGKIDLGRLPDPGRAAEHAEDGEAVADHAPGTVLEKILQVFRTVLDRPAVGPDDDFFESGGHSLSATRAVYSLRERLGVSVAMGEFYRTGTPSRLAKLVGDRIGDSTPCHSDELPEAPRSVALTPGLRSLSEGEVRDAQKSFVFDVPRRLDRARMATAVRNLLERHAALRLRVTGDSVVRGSTEPDLLEFDCPSGMATDAAAAWLHQRVQALPTDTGRGPLMRVAMADVSENRTLLALTVHLLALDGRSLVTLCEELARGYDEPEEGREEDDGYIRYLAWRSSLYDGPERARAIAGWRDVLTDRPESAGMVPPDGPAVVGQQGWAPAPRLHQALRARCAEARVTPFLLHLTAFAVALSRAQRTEHVCVSVALDGRPDWSLDGTVGHFANVVPVPLRIPADADPDSLVEHVRSSCQEIFDRRHVPYRDLAADDPVLTGYLDVPVVFTYARDDGEDVRIAGVTMRAAGPDPLAPGQRLGFVVVDTGQRFRASARYAPSPVSSSDATVMDLYREALYALVFEAGSVRPAAHGTAPDTPFTAAMEKM
ncbi:hypothetical protein GCM10010405_51120 [Streptomyces macrosporus]|uniref:Amino acid adenylation domain-containing protein n=1 Tax=Streptomyces macrosporus TaxID=44032 RepID=A0ABP5XMU4_9ACTN